VPGTAAHHDLCWGCGAVNPFGLHLELDDVDGGVRGRFFVKQDLQGPDGALHDGVLAAALQEALIRGGPAPVVELSFLERAPVGTFVAVEAGPDGAVARREDDGAVLGRGRRRSGG
jgi:hypothetical protein